MNLFKRRRELEDRLKTLEQSVDQMRRDIYGPPEGFGLCARTSMLEFAVRNRSLPTEETKNRPASLQDRRPYTLWEMVDLILKHLKLQLVAHGEKPARLALEKEKR